LKFDKVVASKQIGWEHQKIAIPKLESIAFVAARARDKAYDAAIIIFTWYRFCGSPTNEAEINSINKIMSLMDELFE
jgi:hypothetical protein